MTSQHKLAIMGSVPPQYMLISVSEMRNIRVGYRILCEYQTLLICVCTCVYTSTHTHSQYSKYWNISFQHYNPTFKGSSQFTQDVSAKCQQSAGVDALESVSRFTPGAGRLRSSSVPEAIKQPLAISLHMMRPYCRVRSR